MGAAIQLGTDFFGGTATLLGMALLLIWGLFLLFKIRVRQKGIRLFGAVLTCVTLSMVLGLWRTEVQPDGTIPGGVFGNWIFGNCEPTGLAGFLLFLAVISFIASLLLATDWLFLDYITSAFGLGFETGHGGLPLAGARIDWKNAPSPPGRAMEKKVSIKPPDDPAPGPLHAGVRVLRKELRTASAEAATLEEKPGTPTAPGTGLRPEAVSPEEAIPEADGKRRWWEAPAAAAERGSDQAIEEAPPPDRAPKGEAADAAPLEATDDPLMSAVISYEADAEKPARDESGTGLSMESGETFETFVEESEHPVLLEETPPPVREQEASTKAGAAPPAEPGPSAEPPATDTTESPPPKDLSFFERAARLVVEDGEASISILQKRLNLGYFRSAKLIDQLEKVGIISPPDKNADRKVLFSRVELEGLLRSLVAEKGG